MAKGLKIKEVRPFCGQYDLFCETPELMVSENVLNPVLSLVLDRVLYMYVGRQRGSDTTVIVSILLICEILS